MPELLGWTALALAALPAALAAGNLVVFRAPRRTARPSGRVAVLIPARDEETSIKGALESVLGDPELPAEVHVMDDGSKDATAEIVRRVAARDPRVRLHAAPPLPSGWCGKQHACFALSRVTDCEILLFMDADVRLAPGAVGRIAGFLEESGSDLVSGFPHQETGTLLERLLLPLIHFVLLGYLPIRRMRRSRQTSLAAGCGQLFAARRSAYEKAGGHAAIRASRHDGITLPRAFRRAGLATDLFDASRLASCRMYRGAAQVWRGLAKNATEGMAAPAAVVPWSLLLLGGQVLGPVLLAAGAVAGGLSPRLLLVAGAATLLAVGTRSLLAVRFRQSWLGVLLHPVSVVLLVAIQWYALLRETAGRPVAWKGRHA
ncbi:MAG: glycosyltransferase family 2 protein [Thermoanaerobaculia bacterium]|nr:glycosyltransferase family 2 protein [Thermoanaerobaculia bacterium]